MFCGLPSQEAPVLVAEKRKPFTSTHAHATCELPVYECVALTDHLKSEHASHRHTHSKHGITSGDYIAWIVE